MAPKRNCDEEDHHNNDDTHLQTVAKRRRDGTIDHSLLAALEPVLRKLMEELIPPMLERHVSPCCRFCHNHQGGSSGGRAYQLCFVNGLPQVIFTMANLTAEDGGSLEIELRDAASQQRVDTEEFSSMKAQIYVLDGAFESQDWTAEEFDGNIVKPREGKAPLLRGQTVIKIEKGVGFIDKKRLKITDNSSTTRSKTFRLGVKIVGTNSHGVGIREAISEPFRVKDKRGESARKSERPALNDEVWRLRNIGKAGELRKQLSQNRIKTVKDLLRWDTIGLLRKKFSKINAWDKIIEHAKECELDDSERYLYTYRATEPEKSVSLVFNCIYELVEVIINGQHRSLQSLNSEEERLVGRMKVEAYSNLEHLEPIAATPTTHDDLVSKLTGTQAVSYSAAYQGLQLPDHQGQLESSTSIANDPWPFFFEDEQPNFLYYACDVDDDYGGGGGSCSKGSSFLPNTAEYMSRKGKAKTVWQKVRNAFKLLIHPNMA
ncbi:calmodulin-binding protein 60 G isoform X2 [Vigna radiata var. radiata]|uniref:Calmodulin-binding protein 60 G isoform X2 n=1 Tax=Vigna radiata var. radiata TaxID=3916 RepID=A0A1S3TP19_VIGRR|nr:calmodulin-binding protein 60 G isoform X2 [Vigna radiata var. radiata]